MTTRHDLFVTPLLRWQALPQWRHLALVRSIGALPDLMPPK